MDEDYAAALGQLRMISLMVVPSENRLRAHHAIVTIHWIVA